MPVTIDRALVGRYLTGPDLRRELQRAVDIGAASARRRVGYSPPDPLGRPRKHAKHIRDTIYGRVEVRGGQLVGVLGADHPIALIHHEGSRPHVIRPRREGGRLVFFSRRAGRVVYAKQVRHPGTKGTKFLTGAVADIRRRYS